MEIRKAERIERWVAMYRREGELSFHKPEGRLRKVEDEQRERKRLRMENALQKNSILNCGNWRWRSAISDARALQRKNPAKNKTDTLSNQEPVSLIQVLSFFVYAIRCSLRIGGSSLLYEFFQRYRAIWELLQQLFVCRYKLDAQLSG